MAGTGFTPPCSERCTTPSNPKGEPWSTRRKWAVEALDYDARPLRPSAHLVGDAVEETIHTFALAIEKGFPASEIASRVYSYPTFNADLKFLVRWPIWR